MLTSFLMPRASYVNEGCVSLYGCTNTCVCSVNKCPNDNVTQHAEVKYTRRTPWLTRKANNIYPKWFIHENPKSFSSARLTYCLHCLSFARQHWPTKEEQQARNPKFDMNYIYQDRTICWVKRDKLDATCFIITLFSAQHVSDVNTSILRSLRLIRWVTSWVVSGSMCVGVTLQCGYGGVVSLCRLKHYFSLHKDTTPP